MNEDTNNSPSWGRQIHYDSRIDGNTSHDTKPVNIVSPIGEVISLSPSPVPLAIADNNGKLIWMVTYNDGGVLSQLDARGESIDSKLIDRRRIASFSLIEFATMKVVFKMDFKEGQKFFYRRRSALRPGVNIVEVIHLVGFRMDIYGEEIRHCAFVHESDYKIEFGDFTDSSKKGYASRENWKYAPEWRGYDNIPIGNVIKVKPNFVGEVGFLAACYMEIGGVEVWHQTLIPRLENVAGFVSINTYESKGDFSLLGCETGIGLEAARDLAKAVKVLVVWNVGVDLNAVLPKENRPKIISVTHHDGLEKDYTHDYERRKLIEQASVTDKAVILCDSAKLLIPNGIPYVKIANAPDPLRAKPKNKIVPPLADKKVALVCSRFAVEKRLNFLADVFEKHLMDDWQLLLVGANKGIGHANVKARNNVFIYEGTSTPGDYYAIADVVLSASRHEGYGLATAEAIIAGIPVVSTPTGFLETKPHLATIMPHDATEEEWAEAIRNVKPKPNDDMDKVEDFVNGWKSLLKEMIG